MSNIPPASPPAAPAAPQPPAPKAPLPNGGLPDSIKINASHDASSFFEAHKAANAEPPKAPAATPPVAATPPAEPSKAPPVAATPPAAEPLEKGSLAAKLAAKNRPPAAAAPPAEPPKAPPAVPGTDPEDGIVLDSKYSAPAHESFAQLKTVTKGLRDQLNAARETERRLKSDLEAAKASPSSASADSTEIDTLRREHKSMSDRLAVVDLREHPNFQSQFITPQQQALQEAQTLLDANGVAGIKVEDLLAKPRAEFGKIVSEACKTLPAFDQTDFANHMRTAYGLRQQADQALSKSREVYSALRNQTVDGQKRVFNQTWDKVMPAVGEHLVELDLPDNPTPAQRESIETYNSGVRGLRTQAEQVAFAPAGPEHVATNAIKAAAYDFHIRHAMPRILTEYDNLLTLNRQMADQLRGFRDRNPNRGGSAPGSGDGPGGVDPNKMDHRAAADHFFTQQR